MQQSFYQLSVGVTVEKMIVRVENCLGYKILVSLRAEQERIVELLSAIDREIVLFDHLEKSSSKKRRV